MVLLGPRKLRDAPTPYVRGNWNPCGPRCMKAGSRRCLRARLARSVHATSRATRASRTPARCRAQAKAQTRSRRHQQQALPQPKHTSTLLTRVL